MAVKKKRGRPRLYKICPDCVRRLPIATGFYTWTDNGAPRSSRYCRGCTARRRRKRYAEVRADPYLRARLLRRQNTWAAANKRKANAKRCREYRARLKAERPDVYQQQLEDARIRNRLRKERLNPDVALAPKRAAVQNAVIPRLPVEPLIEFLRHVDLTGAAASVGDSTTRAAFKLLHENPVDVAETTADRVLTAFNGSLASVYPELYS